MRILMYLAFLLVRSTDLAAAPRVVCELFPHKIDQELNFIPAQGAVHVATNRFVSRFFKDIEITLQVKEHFNGRRVRYSSHISAVHLPSGKKWNSNENSNEANVDLAGHNIQVNCSAYERTEDTRSIPNDPRERARKFHLNGGLADREYIRGKVREKTFDENDKEIFAPVEIHITDVDDVLRLLLKHDSVRGPLLKATINSLDKQKAWVSSTAGEADLEKEGVPCPAGFDENLCDIETLFLQYFVHKVQREISYYGTTDHDRGYLNIDARVYRERKSRWIVKYEIIEFSVVTQTPESGGGSSTSGGRITSK